LKVFCPVLLSGKYFPTKYAHKDVKGGQGLSPPVSWGDVRKGVGSFALTMTDKHPSARNQIHWFVINIPDSTRELVEGASGILLRMPSGSMELRNSFGDTLYVGPQPAPGSGRHQYEITVHALDVSSLRLGPYAPLEQSMPEMKKHVIDSASIEAGFG
jgi:Raf kinase inhibitor-like YbhB/YbcL family protein